jgi:hypothetical protein
MRLLAKSHGVEYVSMIDLFCSDIYCAVADATGSPLRPHRVGAFAPMLQ